MKQLDVHDTDYVYREATNTPMHSAGFGILDQSTTERGQLTHKEILQYFEDRLHLAPILRQKLVTVPFDVDRPYWINDPNFDLEFHIRHIALPQPGDWRQLCILVSRINSRPLDLERSPWEVFIIEGLDNIKGLKSRSFAIYFKLHHACASHSAAHALMASLMDREPDAATVPARTAWYAEREPTSLELMLRAIPNNFLGPVRSAPAVLNKISRNRSIDAEEGRVLSSDAIAPRIRFNAQPCPHRVFQATTLPLDNMRALQAQVDGATMGDVVITIIGAALQRYLSHHGEAPEKSLVAKFRDAETASDLEEANRPLFLNMHSDVSSGLQRLQQVSESRRTTALHSDPWAELQTLMPAYFTKRLTNLQRRWGAMRKPSEVQANTLISHMTGPQSALYHTGAKMSLCYAIPALNNEIALAHFVLSYGGNVSFSIFACRQKMQDPDFYMECINGAFNDLYAELIGARKKSGKKLGADQSSKPKRKSRKKVTPRRKATA
ncbi:MAG: wax ester/triacylglycerol synthase domain-containing protein [Pseudomonadales bacterium]